MTFSFRRTLAVAALGALVLALLSATSPTERSVAKAAGDGSGGKAVAHYAGQKVIKKKSITRKAPDGRIFRLNHGATEPTIGIDKDGDMFYAAYGSIPANDILKSTDNAKTWTNVSPKAGPVNTHPVSLDPYVYVDEDTQRVYTIDLTVACSYLSYSDDKGATWISNPLACGTPVNDHQSLFSGPPSTSIMTPAYKNVVYYCYSGFVATTNCTKSIDGGVTFRQTGEPVYSSFKPREGEPSNGRCTGFNGHGAVGNDGTVYLPKDVCETPYLFTSDDEGLTWDGHRVSKKALPYGPDPQVTVDKKGNVYYVWVGEEGRLYMAVSKNKGKSWGPTMLIAAPGVVEAEVPAVDVLAPGKVAISYMGTTNATGKMAKRDYSKATWNGYITVSKNALSDKPLFYSATVNDPKDPFIRGMCSVAKNRCDPVYDFIDVQIHPKTGVPYATFVDGCTQTCIKGTSNQGDEGIVGSLGGYSLK